MIADDMLLSLDLSRFAKLQHGYAGSTASVRQLDTLLTAKQRQRHLDPGRAAGASWVSRRFSLDFGRSHIGTRLHCAR
jgi:hypothetical protein